MHILFFRILELKETKRKKFLQFYWAETLLFLIL